MSGHSTPAMGRRIWHYFWRTRGGPHIGNRGAAMWHDYLFFETVDNYLVSLEARTGEERWHLPLASFEEQYFFDHGTGRGRRSLTRRYGQ